MSLLYHHIWQSLQHKTTLISKQNGKKDKKTPNIIDEKKNA